MYKLDACINGLSAEACVVNSCETSLSCDILVLSSLGLQAIKVPAHAQLSAICRNFISVILSFSIG